ncbi:hypothetical protein [Truepera radiovictrix]|uniref:hypothetical protein n=1 Tax=Truepera radiovictrix TaxID=332249 RepID=UPI0011D084C7|nr:hypothetical protein [Truepera radiovictrix]WMT58339.1 hypothetical protein RCV51_05200 [Truepera radiovictrix]
MFHEEVFLRLFGIPEEVTFLLYGLLTALLLWRFRLFILQSDFLPLVAALAFFTLSIFIDIGGLSRVASLRAGLELFFEDSAKLFGIVGWLFYTARLSLQVVPRTLAVSAEGRARVSVRPAAREVVGARLPER